VNNLLRETNLFLPIYGTVLRKTLIYPYILRELLTAVAKIIQNGALLMTIQILATFVSQNLQVFLWRGLEENISGNQLLGLLNIVPARNFGISLYFSCSEN